MDPILTQALSLAGAAMVLAAYAGSQYAGLSAEGLAYGLLNLAGSAMLAVTVLAPFNAGAFLVEAAWAALSLGAVVRALRRRPPARRLDPSA